MYPEVVRQHELRHHTWHAADDVGQSCELDQSVRVISVAQAVSSFFLWVHRPKSENTLTGGEERDPTAAKDVVLGRLLW